MFFLFAYVGTTLETQMEIAQVRTKAATQLGENTVVKTKITSKKYIWFVQEIKLIA